MILQIIVNGLTMGCVYALIALGYSMVYGSLRFINFAHGDVYMWGACFGLIFARMGNIPFLAALILTMICTGLLGVTVESGFKQSTICAPGLFDRVNARFELVYQ